MAFHTIERGFDLASKRRAQLLRQLEFAGYIFFFLKNTKVVIAGGSGSPRSKTPAYMSRKHIAGTFFSSRVDHAEDVGGLPVFRDFNKEGKGYGVLVAGSD